MKKQNYDAEYKRQTVEYILEQRKSVAQVARELGISANTLHGWIKQYKQKTGGQESQILRVITSLLVLINPSYSVPFY
ncbi:transposase [Ammoniphilus sp. 3BR4]|uniref:transposase n=1 Tax=Ammoniphilus sp. 3BR4 TaxID=3158265 RepID=UPI0034651D31